LLPATAFFCTALVGPAPCLTAATAPSANKNLQTQVGQAIGAGVANTLQQQQQVTDLVAKATAASSNGRPAEALALAEAALKLDASHEMALYERGRALLKLQRTQAALATFEGGLKKNPNSEALHYGAASACQSLKQPREALVHFQALGKLDPKEINWPLAQALLHSELGDDGKAVAALRQAIAIDPKHTDARTILATKLVELGRVGEAAAEYEALANLKPGDAQVKARLAELRQLQKTTDAAIAGAKQAAAGAMPARMDEGPPPAVAKKAEPAKPVATTAPATARPTPQTAPTATAKTPAATAAPKSRSAEVASTARPAAGPTAAAPGTKTASVASAPVADATRSKSAATSPTTTEAKPVAAPTPRPESAPKAVAPSVTATKATVESVPTTPTPAAGYYKLVNTEWPSVNWETDNRKSEITYGPKGPASSLTRVLTFKHAGAVINPQSQNMADRYAWTFETFTHTLAWSVPDKIVPGEPVTFKTSGSVTGKRQDVRITILFADRVRHVTRAVAEGASKPGGPTKTASDSFTTKFPADLGARMSEYLSKATAAERNRLSPVVVRMRDKWPEIQAGDPPGTRETPVGDESIPLDSWFLRGEPKEIHITVGDVEHGPAARYYYRWVSGSGADDLLAGQGPIEFSTDPAGRKELRADGRDGLWILARAKPVDGITAAQVSQLTQNLAFAATGTGSDWLDLGQQKVAGGWKQIYVRASNPTPTTPDIKPPAKLSVTASVQDGSKRYTKTLQLNVTPNALLNAKPDLIEFTAQSGQTTQVKVALDNAGPDKWEFRTEFDKKDRALAKVTVKQDDAKSATLTLKEAGLDPLPNGANDERATLKIFAEQKGRQPVERDIRVVVAQEGLFVDALGRDPRTNQYLLSADGTGKPTEIAFRVFAFDPKTKRIVNLTRDAGGVRNVTVECLEPKGSVAGRLLETGKFRQESGGVRASNEPAGVLRLALAKELPSDGRVVPCDFRLTYTGRAEPGFSAIVTLGIATTGNGPGGKEWQRELARCQEIINRFVPAAYTPKMQAMLDRRKQTLGAEGLFQLRKKIWSAAEALTLGEGGKGYADEAAWAGTITEALEWTQWAGDLAFGAVIGTFTGPYGAAGAGMLKSGVISAINAYDEGRKPDEWLCDQFAMLPAMLEGKVIDPDTFQKWGMQSKAKAWALYISYNFLKNLWNGQSVVEALQNTAKTVGNDMLAGWLNGEVAKHGNRSAVAWAGDKAKETGQAAAKTAGVIKEAVAPTRTAASGTARPATGPAQPAVVAAAGTTKAASAPSPAKTQSDAEVLVRSRTAETYDGKKFAHQNDVLEIMRDPSKVRALKDAPPEVQDAFSNTRESIYGAHDAAVELYLRDRAATDPALAQLRGRKVKVMEFRTPGASSRDINTDRDYRVCYYAGRDPKTGADQWIEVPRKHWEDKSYETFARLTGGPADDKAAARAHAEKHQQLATDKDHAEASAAFSDQKRVFNATTRQFEQSQLVSEKLVLNKATGKYETKIEATSNFEEVAKQQREGLDLADPQSLGRMYQQKVADAHFPHEKFVQANKATKALVELRTTYNVQGREIGQIPKAISDGIEVITRVNERLKADPNRRDPAAIADAERELRQAGHRNLDEFMNKLASQLESLKWMNADKDKRGIEIRK